MPSAIRWRLKRYSLIADAGQVLLLLENGLFLLPLPVSKSPFAVRAFIIFPFLATVRLHLQGKDIAYLAHIVLPGKAQGEGLKAPGIGEDGAMEIHELMQTAELSNQLITGLEMKMVGIGQGALHPQADKIVGAQSSHAGQGGYRNQIGRLYLSMPGSDQSQPGLGFSILL